MEITLISPNSLKIKGKQATFVVDPFDKKIKSVSDAVLLLSGDLTQLPSTIEESRIVVQGAGEYEVGGVKFSGTRTKNDIVYDFRIDSLRVLLGTTQALKAVHEKLNETQVLVIKTDGTLDQSLITALSPQLVVLYGQGVTEEVIKSKGFDTAQATAKVQITAEKLPPEMEVVVLQ